uniref:Si:ch211-255f4.7 n=1 Tax=Eptatretus burgeri TaxID=7764 RepID=A0A8C4QGL5_EPTBU
MATSGLHSSCRNISSMFKGDLMHLSSIWSSQEEPTSQQLREPTWKRKMFMPADLPAFDDSLSVPDVRSKWTPLDYFSEYYDDNYWQLVSEQTNIRGLQDEPMVELKTTPDEIKQFVGSLVVLGCLRLPRIRLCYRPILKIPAVTHIPRDRLFKLRNYLHFVNNLDITAEEKQTNKLWKVTPILKRFRDACTKLPRSQNVCVDEQMIPFSGTTSLRQYAPGKPNPIGLKNFILLSPRGVVLDFVIYQGMETWPNGLPEPTVGIRGSVVLKLSETLTAGTQLYFDRYFTSIPLLDKLKDKGILASGTIMMSNLRERQQLATDKSLKDRGWGSYDELVRSDESMALTKWMDNRSLVVASTIHGSHPETQVMRYSKKDKGYIQVTMPHAIDAYNLNMGAVDMCDRMISYYRICTRTKKWPVRVFFHFIDMALVNSWFQYVQDCEYFGVVKKNIMDLLDFRLYVGEALVISRGPKRKSLDDGREIVRIPRQPLPNRDMRRSGGLHLPVVGTESNNFQRCRKPGCSKTSRIMCTSCNVFFCVQPDRNCFYEFHT